MRHEAGIQETFECKLKGRLGCGSDDLKEMRVLNRIVRITDESLLYETDPRHTEMLIKALHLEDAKTVVTPGIKVPVDANDADKIDQVDSEAADVIKQMIAEIDNKMNEPSKVTFSSDVTYHCITPYAEVYGKHPCTFNFDYCGRNKPLTKSKHHILRKDGVEVHEHVSPNARRSILEKGTTE